MRAHSIYYDIEECKITAGTYLHSVYILQDQATNAAKALADIGLAELYSKFKTLVKASEEGTEEVVKKAATLLMEVSWADRRISDEEMAISAKKLSEIFSLDNHQADALLEEGKILVEESVGLQQFTSLLNENLAADQKFSIVLALWEVARDDNSINALEEHQIRNISELLYVPHSKFIEAKLSSRKAQT